MSQRGSPSPNVPPGPPQAVIRYQPLHAEGIAIGIEVNGRFVTSIADLETYLNAQTPNEVVNTIRHIQDQINAGAEHLQNVAADVWNLVIQRGYMTARA